MIHTYHWTPDLDCAILFVMNALQYWVHIERRDPDLNVARFYALSIEATLFGQTCVVRRWGRIGTCGRTVKNSFDNEGEAVGFFLATLRAKKLRGYRPRSPARHAEATGVQEHLLLNARYRGVFSQGRHRQESPVP